jgi:hypothetical protein
VKIATGTPEDHPTPLPLDSSASPGVQQPTAIQPGQLSGPTIPALDTVAMNLEQQRQGEADCAAAMTAGMTADQERRAFYEADIKPLGSNYGIGMTLPPSPLDPGVGSLGSGEALPTAAFYDPPRGGSPETYTGNEPG